MTERPTDRYPHLDPEADYTAGSYKTLIWLLDQAHSDLNGRTTLDIGGGQSDITATLRAREARALAIDPAYAFLDELEEATTATLTPEGKTETRSKFKQDQAKNPGMYIPAVSTHLPFRANTFDLVYSEQCICPMISRDYQALKRSMLEVVRVLRVDGVAIIFPFDNHEELAKGDKRGAQIQKENLEKALKKLDVPFIDYWSYGIHVKVPGFMGTGPMGTRILLTIHKVAKASTTG